MIGLQTTGQAALDRHHGDGELPVSDTKVTLLEQIEKVPTKKVPPKKKKGKIRKDDDEEEEEEEEEEHEQEDEPEDEDDEDEDDDSASVESGPG